VVLPFTILAISGILHAVVSYQNGRKDGHLDVFWFMLDFVACFMETQVLWLLRLCAQRVGWARGLKEIETSWFGWFFGYIWTAGFFFWSVPEWTFPRLYQDAVRVEEWNGILTGMQIVDSEPK
jgi:hypothetical protein